MHFNVPSLSPIKHNSLRSSSSIKETLSSSSGFLSTFKTWLLWVSSGERSWTTRFLFIVELWKWKMWGKQGTERVCFDVSKSLRNVNNFKKFIDLTDGEECMKFNAFRDFISLVSVKIMICCALCKSSLCVWHLICYWRRRTTNVWTRERTKEMKNSRLRNRRSWKCVNWLALK